MEQKGGYFLTTTERSGVCLNIMEADFLIIIIRKIDYEYAGG